MPQFALPARSHLPATISQHDYAEVEQLGAEYDVSPDVVRHLIRRYGPRREEVVQAIRRGES